jgi:hypothetical protein
MSVCFLGGGVGAANVAAVAGRVVECAVGPATSALDEEPLEEFPQPAAARTAPKRSRGTVAARVIQTSI